jgi:hypothetical protein
MSHTSYSLPQRIQHAALLSAIAALVACGSGGHDDGRASPDSAAGDGDRPDASVDASQCVSEAGSANDAADAEADVSVGDPVCTPRSGTRIKVRWYQSAEGTRVFDSMYDSTLDVRCQPGLTSDGKVRCLPLEQLAPTQWYSDAQCMMPALPITDGCSVPPYAAVPIDAAAGCPTVGFGGLQQAFSVYRVDAAQPDAGAGFVMSGGRCAPSGFDGPLYAATAVADTTFTEGTPGRVTAGRYSMATVDFSDGARYCGAYDGFYDSTLDVTTVMFRSPDQTLRLFPNVPETYLFADSKCTTPAASVGSNACAAARFVLGYDECSYAEMVYSVGAAVDAGFEQLPQPDGGLGCDPVAPSTMQTWHAIDAFPLSALGQVVRHPLGAGRLQYLTYEADGQFRWRQAAAFDSQTGKPCIVASVPGATTTRCVPTPGPQAFYAFSDANCTQRMYAVNLGSSCAAPGANATAFTSDACGRSKIVHIGPAYNGVVYGGSPGACTITSPAPGEVTHQAIDDIDQTMYPELTAVIE